jgi:hypothetical protein
MGLLITLAAVAGFSSYTLFQLDKLRKLQTDTIDLNRHDSLLLVRVQGDINTIGLKLRDMRDMGDGPETHELGRIREDLNRVRADLQESIEEEEKFNPVTRRAGQHATLIRALKECWLPPICLAVRKSWPRMSQNFWNAITKPKNAPIKKWPAFTTG